VIGYSDIQADIARQLIARGITVWINNHRSVEAILQFIWQLGSLVDKKSETEALIKSYLERIEQLKKITSRWKNKPRVYFEEWFDPLITGIEWVSELIAIAGGVDVYAGLKNRSLAKNRIIPDPREVVEKNPDIILASWCGKKFKPARLMEREGWKEIKAVQQKQVFEIDSSLILQPGPAALTDGLESMHAIFKNWQNL
jgi:iron complex transport system substrate-binding protein